MNSNSLKTISPIYPINFSTPSSGLSLAQQETFFISYQASLFFYRTGTKNLYCEVLDCDKDFVQLSVGRYFLGPIEFISICLYKLKSTCQLSICLDKFDDISEYIMLNRIIAPVTGPLNNYRP